MRKKRPIGAPPNRAAKALKEARHRMRIVKSARLYTRKIKHRNRDRDPGSFLPGAERPTPCRGNRPPISSAKTLKLSKKILPQPGIRVRFALARS